MSRLTEYFYFSVFTAAFLLSMMGLWFTAVIPGIDRWSKRFFLSYFTVFLLCCISTILEMLLYFYPVPIAVIYFVLILECLLLSVPLPMYSLILSDQIEQDRRRQREIAEQQREIANHQLEIANQRASIMMLEMRPHFIYNTMTSIYSLCDQDPRLARQVILDFTTYLRKNFTAIASSAPIPFSAELEHIRAYLAVEQALYEDSLFVDYDTPHTMFRVPPLTLQPIVENAVKHGRDPYAGPLHISIRTRKTDSGSEIVIADNGCGYDPAEDSAPHIALKNIQQRLDLMCGGSLTITPNDGGDDGGGTVVTVTVPDSSAE